jgi:nicotinamidase/pyrazinamidase
MKRVFFDIDTQIDFMFPAGALYVPGAERLVPVISRLNHFAAQNGIPLISSMCAHSEDDPEFKQWPPHCVMDTVGQLKPATTMVGQIILEKQQLDLFTNPNIHSVLRELAADEYFVYGVVTEYCVRLSALGLLKTGKPVTLITDAIQHLDRAKASAFEKQFREQGGTCSSLSKVLES